LSELAALLERWRQERTSDLADTIDFLDRAARPTLPLPPRLDEEEGMKQWLASLREETLGPWLGELCAHAWASTTESPWNGLARAASTLANLPDDPRIGRAIERMLQSSSNHWFRIDQVSHAIEAFAKPHDEPSFADRALPLLLRNADRGTAARLAQLAEDLQREADCNGAEMSRRIAQLAERLAPRSKGDRELDEAELARLRAVPVASATSTEKRRVLGALEPIVVLDRSSVDEEAWSIVLRSNARLHGPHLAYSEIASEWKRVGRLHANDSHVGPEIRELATVRIFEDLGAEDIVDLMNAKASIEALGGWLDGAFCETSETLAVLRDAPPTLTRVRLVAGAIWRPKMWPPAKWLELWPLPDHVTRFETWSDDVEGWRAIHGRLPSAVQTVVLDPNPRAAFTEDNVVVLQRSRS